MRFVHSWILGIVLATGLTSAALASDPPTPPQPPPPPPPAREWTILVYMNGDNNLDANAVEDMNEMEKVGSTDQVSVVTQLDRQGNTGTWRYLVKKDTDPNKITSPILETMPEQDMGDPATLKAFVAWGLSNYPAKKTAVIIWNHGSGWEKRARNLHEVRGASYDDSSGNHLSVNQVGQVLREIAASRSGQKLDILGYDCCLMQMIECAGEVMDSVSYHMASEQTEPLDGYPYDDWLADLTANPTWSPAQAGASLVKRYKESYAGGSQGTSAVTQSLVDLGQLVNLGKKLDAFTAAALKDTANIAKLKEASAATQRYADSSHKDIHDFIDQVTSRITTPEVVQAADALRLTLAGNAGAQDGTVLATGATGSMAKSHGLAIWLPSRLTASSPTLARYKNLWFATHSNWVNFLLALGGATPHGVHVHETANGVELMHQVVDQNPHSLAIRDLLRQVQGDALGN